MKFLAQKFSDRHPAVTCCLVTVREPCGTPYRGTAVAIVLEDGRFYLGISLCSTADQFVKKVGYAKALGRAVQEMIASQKAEMSGVQISHGQVGLTDKDHMKTLIACMRAEIREKQARRILKLGAI